MKFSYDESIKFRVELGSTVLYGRYDTTKFRIMIEKCYDNVTNLCKCIDILVDRFNCYDVWVQSGLLRNAHDIKLRGEVKIVIDEHETRTTYDKFWWNKGGING